MYRVGCTVPELLTSEFDAVVLPVTIYCAFHSGFVNPELQYLYIFVQVLLEVL